MADDVSNLVSPEPSWLDDALRAALTRTPEGAAADGALPAAMLEEIDSAIDAGWPQGRPPTVEELAASGDIDDHEPRQYAGDGIGEHGSTHSPADHGVDVSHVHGWHHHEDHSTHIDPDSGPHL